MRYLLLLNNETERVEAWRRMTPEEARAAREEEIPKWGQFFGWLAERGIEAGGLELDDVSRVVRVRGGKSEVTDGPFAETKELVGGYFLIDVDDLDTALEVAQRIPVAQVGSVEIRPLDE